MWRMAPAVLLCCILKGCQSTDSPTPVPQAVRAPVASTSLPEDQIEQLVNHQLSILRQSITWRQCQSGPPMVGQSGTTQPAPGSQGLLGGQGQGNYSAWLKYVADHIASGTGFGTDYLAVAASVMSDFPQLSSTSDTCMAAGSKDTDLQQLWTETTPDSVGKALLQGFAQDDDGTRQAAAQYLRQQTPY